MKTPRPLVPEGIEERFVKVDGFSVRYLTAGDGPPLVFVHGLMGYSFSWSEILPELSRSFSVYAPDMLNLGFSERADVGPSLEAVAGRMLRFLDVLGIKRAVVIGSSHGGAVAMKMAVLAPERVERLVLVSPAHPWSERSRWQIRLISTFLGTPAALAMGILPFPWVAVGLYRMYADFKVRRKGTVRGYSRHLNVRTMRYLLKVARLWNEEFSAFERELPRLRSTPIDLAWGLHDRVVPFSTAHDLHRALPHAALHVFRDCGHLPYEECPQDFIRFVQTLVPIEEKARA